MNEFHTCCVRRIADDAMHRWQIKTKTSCNLLGAWEHEWRKESMIAKILSTATLRDHLTIQF